MKPPMTMVYNAPHPECVVNCGCDDDTEYELVDNETDDGPDDEALTPTEQASRLVSFAGAGGVMHETVLNSDDGEAPLTRPTFNWAAEGHVKNKKDPGAARQRTALEAMSEQDYTRPMLEVDELDAEAVRRESDRRRSAPSAMGGVVNEEVLRIPPVVNAVANSLAVQLPDDGEVLRRPVVIG